MRWEIESEQIIAESEMAEENAMAELGAFGFVAPGYRQRMSEFDADEVVCFYEYGTEWDEYGGCWHVEDCWPEERPLYELF